MGCKIETINLRRARLRQLGEIKLYPAGRPPKSRRRKREDDASDERHPDSQPNPKQRRKLSEREKGALDYAFRGEDTESHIAATVGCLGQSENGKHGSIAPAVWIGNPVVAAPERQTSEQRDIY